MNIEQKTKYFLSHFQKPKNLAWIDKNFFLREVLKITSSKFVREMSREGLIDHPGIEETVEAEYTVAKLREIAKKLGIHVSGKKEQIVEALVESSSATFAPLIKEYYVLTSTGRTMVVAFLNQEEKIQQEFDGKIISSLAARDVDTALDHFKQFLSYFSYRYVDEGFAIPRDFSEDKAILKYLLDNLPKMFNGATTSQVDELHRVGAFAWLRGEQAALPFLSSGFSILPHLDAATTVRMLIFFGYYLRDRRKHVEAGVKKVKVLCVDDGRTCDDCSATSGRVYDIKIAPELPHQNCDSEMGCRCVYIAHEFSEN